MVSFTCRPPMRAIGTEYEAGDTNRLNIEIFTPDRPVQGQWSEYRVELVNQTDRPILLLELDHGSSQLTDEEDRWRSLQEGSRFRFHHPPPGPVRKESNPRRLIIEPGAPPIEREERLHFGYLPPDGEINVTVPAIHPRSGQMRTRFRVHYSFLDDAYYANRLWSPPSYMSATNWPDTRVSFHPTEGAGALPERSGHPLFIEEGPGDRRERVAYHIVTVHDADFSLEDALEKLNDNLSETVYMKNMRSVPWMGGWVIQERNNTLWLVTPRENTWLGQIPLDLIVLVNANRGDIPFRADPELRKNRSALEGLAGNLPVTADDLEKKPWVYISREDFFLFLQNINPEMFQINSFPVPLKQLNGIRMSRAS